MSVEAREKLIDIFFTEEDDRYSFLYQTYIIQEEDDEEFTEEFLTQAFNFCGCGCLSMSINFIKDILNCFEKDDEVDGSPYLSYSGLTDLCHEDGNIMDFILHYLDTVDLTEHGSSVYGSWLTEKGNALKEYLNEYWKGKEE